MIFKKVNSESDSQEDEEAECDTCNSESEVENEDDDMNAEFQGYGSMATARAEFKLKISDMREAVKNSLLDLAKKNGDAFTVRQYVEVVERRQSVVEKMADEWGDPVYSKFELKLWIKLFHYFNSEQSQADMDALAQSIIGMIKKTLTLKF